MMFVMMFLFCEFLFWVLISNCEMKAVLIVFIVCCLEQASEMVSSIGADSRTIQKKEKVVIKKLAKEPVVSQHRKLDVSVTISVESDDIEVQLLQKAEEFINKECIFGLCSIERGGAMSRLHLQMVCRLVTSSAAMVSKLIKLTLDGMMSRKIQ